MNYNKKEQLLDKINGLRLTSTNASDTLYNRGVVNAFSQSNYTKNKLEELNLEWVFDCPGIKLEEVE